MPSHCGWGPIHIALQLPSSKLSIECGPIISKHNGLASQLNRACGERRTLYLLIKMYTTNRRERERERERERGGGGGGGFGEESCYKRRKKKVSMYHNQPAIYRLIFCIALDACIYSCMMHADGV